MGPLEHVSAQLLLQLGALCVLVTFLCTMSSQEEDAWEHLDAVRSEIEQRREHG